MNSDGATLRWVYMANAAVLITHEIDSAYWHEWTLFHLPGGIELFLVANFVLLLIVLYGFDRVIRQAHAAKTFSYLLAGTGIFAFTAHIGFIWAGFPEFRTPVSIGVLLSSLCLSVVQIVLTARIEVAPTGGE